MHISRGVKGRHEAMVSSENCERRRYRRNLRDRRREECLVRVVLCQHPLVLKVDHQIADVARGEAGAVDQLQIGRRCSVLRLRVNRRRIGGDGQAHQPRRDEAFQPTSLRQCIAVSHWQGKRGVHFICG